MSKEVWLPKIRDTGQPKYIELAIAIGEDIAAGRLKPGQRLPPQRRIAEAMGVDISLISRSYAEAARRGFVQSHVGRGTFVSEAKPHHEGPDPQRVLEEDPRMNMPPEIEDAALIERMQRGLDHVASNIVPLLRYQSATGGKKDREVSIDWMQSNGRRVSPNTLTITPGAHAAIQAALMVIRKPETVILCEPVTYPGIRAIAAQLSIPLIALEEDEKGVLPAAIIDAAAQHPHAVLYLNPTLRNPTTHTIPNDRRMEIADTLRSLGMQLIEDDAYGLVVSDTPIPISDMIPDLAWHILGVSKAFGAGLRLAYATAPDRAQLSAFVQVIRTTSVMTSPLNLALLSTWIEQGTADAVVAETRRVARRRQDLAARVLPDVTFESQPEAFNIWMQPPLGLSRAEVLARTAGGPIGIVPSDVFTVGVAPGEFLRVCLGGPLTESALEDGLINLRAALMQNDWSG
ncbi:GntR family transcriptional regulator [Actibacterium mucosum KCTC 23349]|uniref:GntR family transcriptional regulator n=1 Tax=Actibacterium mucosum KCTC 23349 TaxID=1454373 RepID=A0A037ZFN7_9RHOB|nr:PLP-dependent aminotransferase family protein [Actibacterium mucosum]KAJ54351.1 GntR family transcriptional regulator [Actibacterium mucosum KCTC 23349]